MELSKKREHFEVKLDLEEQMRKLERKKALERQKRIEEGMKVKRRLLRQIVLLFLLIMTSTHRSLAIHFTST
jgi:hypothetical protein